MSAQVPRKRARSSSNISDNPRAQDASLDAEASQASSQRTRTRDEQFWYPDGNIILVARDVEFRLYRGLLAEHSEVFRDMLSFPQPPIASASAAGSAVDDACPVVHITDSPEDFRHILRFYFPGLELSPFFSGDPSFGVVSAAIRLGLKYQMLKLYLHAINYLKEYYTNNFPTWMSGAPTFCPPAFDPIHSIGVVNLARLTGETSLLPTALLLCCTLDADIVTGFTREDGTREQLSPDDLGLCFAAKGRLVRVSVRIALTVFQLHLADNCETRLKCVQGTSRRMRGLRKRVEAFATANPFVPVHGFFKDIPLCRQCEASTKERDLMERRAVWDRLPELLGIDAQDEAGAEA